MTGVVATYDAVIFDNDGVLTHPTSRTRLLEATESALRAFNCDPTDDDIRSLVDDLSVETVERLADKYHFDPEQFWRLHEREHAATQAKAIRIGEKSLYNDVDIIHDIPVPTAVVSNNQHAFIKDLITEFDLEDAFVASYGRIPTLNGLTRRKPDPSYLRATLEELEGDSALYVGDSRVDIAAARAVEIDSAFITRPHRADYQLPTEPTYRLDSLRELKSITPEQCDTSTYGS